MAAFTLTPAESVTGIVDFAKVAGRKLYDRAAKPLDKELYNWEPDSLYQFVESVYERANEIGWQSKNKTGIVHIPKEDGEEGFDDVIKTRGNITLSRIREFEESYINSESKVAQETRMLYKTLWIVWAQNDYVVAGFPLRVVLLKVIICESILDSDTTTSDIRNSLSLLDKYIQKVDCDINELNSSNKSPKSLNSGV